MKKFAFILPLALGLVACNGTTQSTQEQAQDSIPAECKAIELGNKVYQGTIPAADAAVAYDVHLLLNEDNTYREVQVAQDGETKGVEDVTEGKWSIVGDTLIYGEDLLQKKGLLIGDTLQLLDAEGNPAEQYLLSAVKSEEEHCHH